MPELFRVKLTQRRKRSEQEQSLLKDINTKQELFPCVHSHQVDLLIRFFLLFFKALLLTQLHPETAGASTNTVNTVLQMQTVLLAIDTGPRETHKPVLTSCLSFIRTHLYLIPELIHTLTSGWPRENAVLKYKPKRMEQRGRKPGCACALPQILAPLCWNHGTV